MGMKKYKRAAVAIREACGEAPLAMVLGSGMGGFEEQLSEARSLPYAEIPGFPVSTVPGHAGRFTAGTIREKRLLLMSGRFHSYEGYSMEAVTMPVRVMKLLGVETLLLTNAAGGVNPAFSPGDLMLITDFINLTGRNPLRGRNLDPFGPRFPDMSRAYDAQLRELASREAERLGFPLREGVYCWMNGPSFETPAEIRMVRKLGADAVGMSTVPETIVARHCGMRVLGISTITNMAAGILEAPISHDEVLEVGRTVRDRFASLLKAVIGGIAAPALDLFGATP